MTSRVSSASIRRREASPRFPIGVAARMITAPSLRRVDAVTDDRAGSLSCPPAEGHHSLRPVARARCAPIRRSRARCRLARAGDRDRCWPACCASEPGAPHAIVFDETYYVKDAWTPVEPGLPGELAARAPTQFLAGQSDTSRRPGSFVVHPPLGKWLIALGMALFGPTSGRMAIRRRALRHRDRAAALPRREERSRARRLRDGRVGSDRDRRAGHRDEPVALLDGILTFFILLAFWFVAARPRRTISAASRAQSPLVRTAARRPRGDRALARPWLLAAGPPSVPRPP